MRTIIALALFCGSCMAQSGAPVQFQQVFNGVSVATNSAPLQNSGQATHILVIGLRNAPSQTCVAASSGLLASIQASGDQSNPPTNWFTPPAQSAVLPLPNAAGSQYVKTEEVRATGSYSWIRATVSGFDTTNCVADGFYFGSQQAVSLSQPVVALSFNPATSGNTSLIANSGANTQGRVFLVGAVIYNVTAGQTLKFTAGNGGTVILQLTSMPANFLYTLPLLQTGGLVGSYGSFNAGTDLVVNLSANTEVGITLIYMVQ